MKIPRLSLLEELTYAARIIEKKPGIEILSRCLIHATDETFEFKATDTELSVAVSLTCGGALPAICPPLARLRDVVSVMAGASLTLEAKNGRLKIEDENGNRAEIDYKEPGEFPTVPQVQNGEPLSVPSSGWLRALRTVAVSTGQRSGTIDGVRLTFRDGILFAESTDVRRATLVPKIEHSGTSPDRAAVIPSKAVSALIGLDGGAQYPIELAIGTNHLSATLFGRTVTARLLEADNFHDVAAMVQRAAETTATVQVTAGVKDLDATVRRAMLFSEHVSEKTRESLHVAAWKFDKGSLTISSRSDRGSIEASVAVRNDRGKPWDFQPIGISPQYVSEILGACGVETVSILLGGEESNAVVIDPEDGFFRYVIARARL